MWRPSALELAMQRREIALFAATQGQSTLNRSAVLGVWRCLARLSTPIASLPSPPRAPRAVIPTVLLIVYISAPKRFSREFMARVRVRSSNLVCVCVCVHSLAVGSIVRLDSSVMIYLSCCSTLTLIIIIINRANFEPRGDLAIRRVRVTSLLMVT